MTTGSSEARATRKQDQQPQTRGGAAPDDRSKSMGDEEDGPFGSSEEDVAEPKKGASTGKASRKHTAKR